MIANARSVLFLALVAGCPSAEPTDVCDIGATGTGGRVELGLGDPFVPVVEGSEVEAQIGLQGLYMFIVNARAHGLAVTDAEGAVDIQLTGPGGVTLSLDSGCRGRTFTDIGDGTWQLDSPYFTAILPEYNTTIDGMAVTLRVTVTDAMGLAAFDERSFTARLPLGPGAR